MIYWLCWPLEYKNSWIAKYSSIYISKLKRDFDIKEFWMPFKANSLLRMIFQFVIIPIRLLFHRRTTKIFYDEGRLPILFYPIKNIIFIIHDIRDYALTAKKQSFLQKIYFKIIGISYKKLNKVYKIITPSAFTRDSLIDLWIDKEKIKVIPNVIDQSVYKPLTIDSHLMRRQLFDKYGIKQEDLNKRIILNIWSEEDRKNIITILKALTLLGNYLFIKIWNPIISSNRKKHLDFAKTNALDCVFIDTIFDDEDIVKFYNIADVFIFPSLFEWFGRPPIEAQACGCPVISTNNSWLKEVIWDSAFIIKNPLDEHELYQKINALMSDNSLYDTIVDKWYQNAKRFILDTNLIKWQRLLGK